MAELLAKPSQGLTPDAIFIIYHGAMSEKHHFQAEIEQLLNIVIHSLYTDQEIFVRELISNAADACEKLRFLQASGQVVFQAETAMSVSITTDEKEKTITFTDTGVGMTHDEMIENIGTIAHSGSKAFLQKLAAEKKADASLIGQFGVGFYSAFMVGKKVEVYSRSCQPDETGQKWTSEGSGGYEIEPMGDLPRGTKVVIHLKDENESFSKADTIEHIIKRYSNFVPFTIELNGKTINTVRALWSRNKSEIKDEEYQEFYHYISHDTDNPIYRLHFNADAPLAIQSLLYVPARNLETLGLSRSEHEVNLYSRKVLIQAKAKGIVPEWLRFLKGVVDSEDIPLNISRETMQDTTLIQKLNQVLTGRFLKFLEEQAEKDPENYDKFYQQYSRYLKEGIVSSYAHNQILGKLLRYESSTTDKGKKTSLADYVKRMTGDQKEIYFLFAHNRETAESSPYYEVFKAKNYEVLFLDDPWDEFVMEHLREFDGKSIRPAEKADIKIEEPAKTESELSAEASASLANWLKEVLGEKVGEVRVSHRLVGSPAVVVDSDKFMTASMRRIIKSMQKDGETSPMEKHDFEINPRHGIMVRLEQMRQSNAALASKVAEQLLDNARVSAGLLEDPRSMINRLNELLEQVLTSK
jgi:molecular chaperone HtpG